MKFLKWRFAVLMIFVGCKETACSYIELYDRPNYDDLHFEMTFNETTENQCINVVDLGMGSPGFFVRSIRTDRCIMLYTKPGCQHMSPDDLKANYPWFPRNFTNWLISYRVDKSEPDVKSRTGVPIENSIHSFHVCSQSRGGGPEVDVDFYEKPHYEGKILAQYKNVCGCKNIPISIKMGNSSKVSIDNHGRGIELFEKSYCRGDSVVLDEGYSLDSQLVLKGYKGHQWWPKEDQPVFDIRSFRPTDNQNCIRLDASIYKFRFRNGTSFQNGSQGLIEEVKLATDTVLRANGNVKLIQDYNVISKISETVDFTIASAYTNMHNVGVDYGYEAEFEGKVLFLFKGKAKHKLGLSYKWTRTTSDTTTNRTSITNEETVGVSQKIEMGPCQECTISSYVRKVKNFPIEYESFSRVRGTAGGRPMTASEVKLYLPPGAKYVDDYDVNTVTTVVTGVMFAEFGVSSFINADCVPIKNCAVVYHQTPGNKTSTTFEHPITYIKQN